MDDSITARKDIPSPDFMDNVRNFFVSHKDAPNFGGLSLLAPSLRLAQHSLLILKRPSRPALAKKVKLHVPSGVFRLTLVQLLLVIVEVTLWN